MPVAVLLGGLLVAGSLLGVQYMKQSSIERQKQADITAKRSQELRATFTESARQTKLEDCMDVADELY